MSRFPYIGKHSHFSPKIVLPQRGAIPIFAALGATIAAAALALSGAFTHLLHPLAMSESQAAAVESAAPEASASAQGSDAPSVATTSVTYNITQPVIERTVAADSPYAVTHDELAQAIAVLTQQFSRVPAPAAPVVSSSVVPISIAAFAQSQRIDHLSGARLSDVTVDGISGITDDDIPDDVTASNYLPLSGGELTGALVGTDLSLSGTLAAGALSVAGVSSAGAVAAPYFTSTSTTATSSFAGPLTIGGRFGVGTSTPASIVDIFGTDALRIPVGSTAQRPGQSGTGQIRYNTTTHQFEGYGDGGTWQGLGGVVDADQDTQITADTAGADEDTLRFFTGGSERATLSSDGKFGIGTTSPTDLLSASSSGYAKIRVTGNTASALVVDTSDAGNKALALGAGSIGSALTFDNRSYFAITTDNKADVADLSGTNMLYLEGSTGRVGLGAAITSSAPPAVLFEVRQSTGGEIQRWNTTGGSAVWATFARAGTPLAYFGVGNPGDIFTDGLSGATALRAVNALQFGTNGDNVRMTIDTAGDVGIGTTDPDEGKLEVKGGTVCVDSNSDGTAGSCIASESDERLKTNITPLDASESLATVLKLNPVSFDWRVNDAEVLKHYPLIARFASSTHSIGLIAQQVAPLVPEAIEQETVGDDEVQYFQLDYTKLVPLLIGAAQELSGKIAAFRDRIDTRELTYVRASGEELRTQRLCIGETCVTEDELKALLAGAGQAASSQPGPIEERASEEGASEESELATTTEESIEEIGQSTEETSAPDDDVQDAPAEEASSTPPVEEE